MRKVILLVFFAAATAAYAQKSEPATATTPNPATASISSLQGDSHETRERFKELMRRQPPQVGTVLKLDPTLFSNQAFLANYPAIAAFVAEHPEVPHNPEFYLDGYDVSEPDRRSPGYRMWEDIMQGLFILAIFATIVTVVTWLIRTLIEQRRWSRLSRVQTEVHGKLLDRLASNEDLLKYIETPAGRRFLESAPIPVDTGSRQISAPIGRILWSIQAGLVVAAAGIGMHWVSGNVDKDAAQGINALGVVAICVGFGFVLSAIVSFVLSRRLKLFEAPETPNV